MQKGNKKLFGLNISLYCYVSRTKLLLINHFWHSKCHYNKIYVP